MAPPIIEPVLCMKRPKRCTSTSCRCPATAPTSCRSRRSGAGSGRMSPTIIAIPPPKISAGGLPISRPASIRTLTPSPTAFGSKIGSTLTKKNYASQGRRGLGILNEASSVSSESRLNALRGEFTTAGTLLQTQAAELPADDDTSNFLQVAKQLLAFGAEGGGIFDARQSLLGLGRDGQQQL